MLPAKRDSDNGNTEKKAKEKVCQCDPESTENNPDDVHDGRKASGIGRSICNFYTKGREANNGKFKTLQPKRDTDDR
jgi:hypothetical protein